VKALKATKIRLGTDRKKVYLGILEISPRRCISIKTSFQARHGKHFSFEINRRLIH
jgi:hypothetical protein